MAGIKRSKTLQHEMVFKTGLQGSRVLITSLKVCYYFVINRYTNMTGYRINEKLSVRLV